MVERHRVVADHGRGPKLGCGVTTRHVGLQRSLCASKKQGPVPVHSSAGKQRGDSGRGQVLRGPHAVVGAPSQPTGRHEDGGFEILDVLIRTWRSKAKAPTTQQTVGSLVQAGGEPVPDVVRVLASVVADGRPHGADLKGAGGDGVVVKHLNRCHVARTDPSSTTQRRDGDRWAGGGPRGAHGGSSNRRDGRKQQQENQQQAGARALQHGPHRCAGVRGQA